MLPAGARPPTPKLLGSQIATISRPIDPGRVTVRFTGSIDRLAVADPPDLL